VNKMSFSESNDFYMEYYQQYILDYLGSEDEGSDMPSSSSHKPPSSSTLRCCCAQCDRHIKPLDLDMGLASSCRCARLFCPKHRAPEDHKCDFDYKTHGRQQLKATMPKVESEKLHKI
ncbi:unnamed protein product, partial [Meganyctiphanes norvegica]